MFADKWFLRSESLHYIVLHNCITHNAIFEFPWKCNKMYYGLAIISISSYRSLFILLAYSLYYLLGLYPLLKQSY